MLLLPRESEKPLVYARVGGQLGVERREQQPAVADEHRLAIVLGEHLDTGPDLAYPRRTDEDPVQRPAHRRARAPPRSWPPAGRTRSGRRRGRPARGACGRARSSPHTCRRRAARSGGSPPRARTSPTSRMIVVDSPPGITSPSRPSSCSGRRTSTTSAPSSRSTRACSRNAPAPREPRSVAARSRREFEGRAVGREVACRALRHRGRGET